MYHTHAIARSDEQGHESEWESERECFCVFGFCSFARFIRVSVIYY